MLAAADPVVTSDGGQLRFEVFSVCCGAYARFDLAGTALGGDWLGKGTTNVDFNPPMRAALTAISASDRVGLKIGESTVELERAGQAVVERKVKLPVRWLKSFVEVQSYQAMVSPVLEMPPLELAKLLRTLPVQNFMQAGVVTYIVPLARGYRLSQRDAPGAVAVGAISRLKALEPILRYASSVKIYSCSAAVSAFELTMPEGRFYLVLSPNAARGFSGEGQALTDLTGRIGEDLIARVKSGLAWQSELVPNVLGESLGLVPDQIINALQILGTRGLVGYDLSGGHYFHRELPFDLSLVEDLHPRALKARKLVADGCVKITIKDGGVDGYVRGESAEHFVQIKDDSFRCTCPWHLKYDGQRGPCSHVLAVEIKLQEDLK
jgi:hypothetical protein